jgi:hypothetical protein
LTTGSTTGSITLTTNSSTSSTIVQALTATSTAFEVQNAAGIPVFDIDTNNGTPNIVTNPGFEVGTTYWATDGSGTGLSIAQNTTRADAYNGLESLKVVTASTAANSGAKTATFTTPIASATTYTLSFYAMASGSGFSTLEAGRADNGSTETNCTLSSTSVVTTGFQRYSCTFTTGTVSGSPYIYIDASTSAQVTFYLDAVQLEPGTSATAYNIGGIQLRGVIENPLSVQNLSNSSSEFAIQNASGVSLLTVNSITGTITFGSGSNTVTYSSTGIAASGTARHAKSVVLTPEYAGAVLDALSDTTCSSANNGTMTSGLDGTQHENYYNWTSGQASAQCYDVVVSVPVPSDWSAWNTTPLSIQAYSTSTSNGTIQAKVLDTTNTAESGSGYTSNECSVTPGSASTWATSTSCTLNGTYTANGTMTLILRMSSLSSSNVRLGNITLNYLSSY